MSYIGLSVKIVQHLMSGRRADE